jgi:YHS domain-containing protein
MRDWIFRSLGVLAVLAAAFVAGCGNDHAAKSGHEGDDPGEHMKTDEQEGSEASEAPGGLSAADQALVRAQKICPVSGEELGSMGEPVKVSAGDKTVFLCCEGCRKKFNREPEKYLAKLEGADK